MPDIFLTYFSIATQVPHACLATEEASSQWLVLLSTLILLLTFLASVVWWVDQALGMFWTIYQVGAEEETAETIWDVCTSSRTGFCGSCGGNTGQGWRNQALLWLCKTWTLSDGHYHERLHWPRALIWKVALYLIQRKLWIERLIVSSIFPIVMTIGNRKIMVDTLP